MNRSGIIVAAVVLALLGAIVPIAAMLHFSRVLATEREHERLALIADRVITRADMSLKDAVDALREIDAFTGTPCSPAHIGRMREITINTRTIDEIGYFADGVMKCNSWGITEGIVRQSPPDFTIAGDVGVTVSMQPQIARKNPMMALQYRAYNALIDPVRFVDVVVSPDVKLAVATGKGVLLARLNDPDQALVAKVMAGSRNKGAEGGYLFALARAHGWTAVAMEPKSMTLQGVHRERMLLVPFGVFLSLLTIAGVGWLSRRRLSPRGELQIAVRKREFVVHYQPIVEMRTGACVGAEALVRWRRPDGSLLRPDLFIPLAEESGLIKPITDQVIAQVVEDLNRLLVADRSMHIAINLCAEDVGTGRALPVIEEALRNTGIRPDQIWLEATERGFIDIEAARVTLTHARERGYAVAIDDFGTGYSSLSYLEGLPLDALKIDKSFIDTVGTDSATSSVTSHIIDMAKTLKLAIVAEGIETQAQADHLAARGVEYGQGWLYAKPMPVEEFIAYWRKMKKAVGSGAKALEATSKATSQTSGQDAVKPRAPTAGR